MCIAHHVRNERHNMQKSVEQAYCIRLKSRIFVRHVSPKHTFVKKPLEPTRHECDGYYLYYSNEAKNLAVTSNEMTQNLKNNHCRYCAYPKTSKSTD